MNQPPLPFPHLALPAKHLAWFQLANAGDYPEKKEWFYPLKAHILQRHALPDGYDLQIIRQPCWCGDGIWRGADYTLPEHRHELCHRCGGTGLYRLKHIVLRRWLLGVHTYHQPTDFRHHTEEPELNRDYIVIYHGLIKHETTPARTARRAMLHLLLRYQTRRAFDYLRAKWQVSTRRARRLLTRVNQWLDDSLPVETEHPTSLPF